ncbi:hypothetical protein O6H91_09G006700 [Diphasiastrum complanatum]|uniref:Uncharacterized protein n=1 Tax=Diphasiastrum complanatum TaxID=34168 RepID=A0ACC2CLV4_DIPCM|nr:hypothetical protein O6H91_09G006700 [Diphasiastrum complanatum]
MDVRHEGCVLLFMALVSLCAAQPSTVFPDGSLERDFQTWLAFVHATSDPSSFGQSLQLSDTSENKDGSSGIVPDVLGKLKHKIANAEKNKRLIVVAQDGSGDFRTITEALLAVPMKNKNRTIIYIKSGIYSEKIEIPKTKPFITLLGDGENQTIITGNATAGDLVHQFPFDTSLRTYHSATVGVNSNYFIAKNIRFENTAPAPNPGEIGKQAVAFRISGDSAAIYNCSFYGAQDTLYDHSGRHYFKNCYIQGSIDFIFGYARSLYKNSQLHSIANGIGSITAQKRNDTILNSGFSFVNCSVTGSGNLYLGRAWGDRSRVVYAFTYMDNIILPEGWFNWGDPSRNKTVFYAQYKCGGPGANTDSRVAWARELTPKEAKPFLSIAFINAKNWLQEL